MKIVLKKSFFLFVCVYVCVSVCVCAFLIAFLPSGCIVSWKRVFSAGGVGNLARLDMAGRATWVQRRPVWESSTRDAWARSSCWHVDPVTPLQSQVQLSTFIHFHGTHGCFVGWLASSPRSSLISCWLIWCVFVINTCCYHSCCCGSGISQPCWCTFIYG